VTADVVGTVDGRAQGAVEGAFGVAEDVVERDVKLGDLDLGHAENGIVTGRKLGNVDSEKGDGMGGPAVNAVLVFDDVRGKGEFAHEGECGGSPQARNFEGSNGAHVFEEGLVAGANVRESAGTDEARA
jgi:hypothetical protein